MRLSKNAETQNRSKIDGFCLTLHVFVMKVIWFELYQIIHVNCFKKEFSQNFIEVIETHGGRIIILKTHCKTKIASCPSVLCVMVIFNFLHLSYFKTLHSSFTISKTHLLSGNCGSGHIYWRNPSCRTSFFCAREE